MNLFNIVVCKYIIKTCTNTGSQMLNIPIETYFTLAVNWLLQLINKDEWLRKKTSAAATK